MEEKYVLIDERMRPFEKEYIKGLGYNLIEVKKCKDVYEEISSHVDIFACRIKDNLIVAPNINIDMDRLENICKEKNISLIIGEDKVILEYPRDIIYNICVLKDKYISKIEDKRLKEILDENEYIKIKVNQGYAKCSISVIDENTLVTMDKGIQQNITKFVKNIPNKKLENTSIDVIYLNNIENIRLLNKENYSKKSGFIGGCTARLGSKYIVFGDITKILEKEEIDILKDKLEKLNIELVDFKGYDVIDYGGVVEI